MYVTNPSVTGRGTGTASSSRSASERLQNLPLPNQSGRSTRPSRINGSTPKPDPLKITIGIELEFILAVSTYPNEVSHDNYDEMLGQELVRYALSQPMRGTCATCGKEHLFQLPLNPKDEEDYEQWTVEEDESLFMSNEELRTIDRDYFHRLPIEVKSRILRPRWNLPTTRGHRSSSHVHELGYTQEIDAVLKILHSFFSGVKGGDKIENAHIIVNSTCGLHIHVGNEERGFPLPTVKKLLSTYVANERATDNLYAASRINGSRLALESLRISSRDREYTDLQLLPAAYNPSSSCALIQAAHALKRHRHGYNETKNSLPRPNNNDRRFYPGTLLDHPKVGAAVTSFHVADWLDVIDHAPTLKAVLQLQGNFLRPTLNLRNLAPYDSKGLTIYTWVHSDDDDSGTCLTRMMTIEFRQHMGTLEAAEIYAWMDIVVSMVVHAHYTPDADYKDLCRDEWLKPDHGSIDLPSSLGCSRDTKRFYRERLGTTAWSPDPDEGVFAADVDEIDLLPIDAMIAPLVEYVKWEKKTGLQACEC